MLALSEDGQVLTGRFGNGEYWNGFRTSEDCGVGDMAMMKATPRETMRTLLIAVNAAIYSGNARALRRIDQLLTYAGEPTTAGDRTRRRTLMFDILDMSTFRIMDIPTAPGEVGAPSLTIETGPAATAQKTEVAFRTSPATVGASCCPRPRRWPPSGTGSSRRWGTRPWAISKSRARIPRGP